MNDDERFEEFIERYCESGDARVPGEWSSDLRHRCAFFVRMLDGERTVPGAEGTAAGGASLVSQLAEQGVEAKLTLEGPGGPAPPAGGGRNRYVFEHELARGGMGRIVLAYDRDFRRRVAVKVMLGMADSARLRSRFLEEAQATAQLEHPNIAPVYDLGLDPSGAPFFAMKWIRGRDLKSMIASPRRDLSLIQLVQILQQAAMGAHYANSRGVIHRDLKPQNIMVGDYGEVLVLDWGLAKVLKRGDGGPADEGSSSEPVGGRESGISTERRDSGALSLEGAAYGTPAYMSPEQARGTASEIDARTDVFGLGSILYEILAGTPPYPGGSTQVALGQAREARIAPPTEAVRGRSVPRALEEICMKALAPRKEDRFQSARELHDALQRFVEGTHDAERRSAEAKRLRGAADAQRAALEHAENREQALSREEARLRSELADHAPEEAKRPLWDVSSAAGASREEARAAFNRVIASYLAVLNVAPEDAATRASLSGIFLKRLLAAEDRGDREAAGFYQELAGQYHDGKLSVELEGRARIRLECEPGGASVFISRYEEKGPVLVASEPELAGTTPLSLSLPRGSYLALLRKEGCVETRYPFFLRRGADLEARIELVAEGSIPDGFLQIAAGESIVGGDAAELRVLPRQTVAVGELFAGRFPVTLGEYCDFLNDGPSVDPQTLQDFLPQFGAESYVLLGPDGRFVPIERLGPNVPAISILDSACDAYCEWLGRKLGKKTRLLQEVEWERCARGADGRRYPWGNGFDWSFCKGGSSRPGKPFPEPVGAFPRDESPFGVRDLAGGVRDLCAGTFGLGSYDVGYRPLRGGSWLNPYPMVFRADCRTTRAQGAHTTDAGFRVCYSR